MCDAWFLHVEFLQPNEDLAYGMMMLREIARDAEAESFIKPVTSVAQCSSFGSDLPFKR